MSAWVVVPCLLALRDEFNQLSPARDKGADGTIGDSSHTSSSDHTPDEDSDVLRDHDADDKNEVHALDIDSSGPWPGSGTQHERFDGIILDLVERERAEYNHPTIKARLKYVIWNRHIASRSNGWAWTAYTGSDPHTNHAHFSALYTTSTEADTRAWGVAGEDDMPLTSSEIELIADAVWKRKLQDPYAPNDPDRAVIAGTWLRYTPSRAGVERVGTAVATLGASVESRLAAIEAGLARVTAPEVDLATLKQAIREVLREGLAD